MSTMTLVLLGIVTTLLAIGTLILLRMQEQKRLQRARLAIHHADMANELNMTGEQLQPWLSPAMLLFMAREIQRHAQALSELNAPANKGTSRALENAVQWQHIGQQQRRPYPSDSREAQKMRASVRSLIEYLREAYKQRIISSLEAKKLLSEARIIGVRIPLAVFDDKATAAASLHNHHQAIYYLEKMAALINQQHELPPDLKEFLQEIKQRIAKHELERSKDAHRSRLEEAADEMNAEEESWKKKYFD